MFKRLLSIPPMSSRQHIALLAGGAGALCFYLLDRRRREAMAAALAPSQAADSAEPPAPLYLQPDAAVEPTPAVAGRSVLHHFRTAQMRGGVRVDGLTLIERTSISGTKLVLIRGCDSSGKKNGKGVETAASLPFENALTCPVSDPRIHSLPTRHPHVRVAACVLAVDWILVERFDIEPFSDFSAK